MGYGPCSTVPGYDATSLEGLGHVERVHDPETGCWYDRIRLYNDTGGALTQYACYRMSFDGDEEFNPKAIVAAAVATLQSYMVVALEATAAAGYGWFAIRGTVPLARCDGTTDIAKDDFLKLAPGTDADAMIKDGTAETISSVAIAREAFTTNANGNVRVFLLGVPKIINT